MINIITNAIRSVKNRQFFSNELSYQGELLAEIRQRLADAGLPEDAILQQEYQKRLIAHKINVRPDMIIHVPTKEGGDRKQGNFVVFELNKAAGPKEVQEDFANLDTMIRVLRYPFAVFINVASGRTQARHYKGPFKSRLHCFSVRRSEGRLLLKHAHWKANELVEESESIEIQE